MAHFLQVHTSVVSASPAMKGPNVVTVVPAKTLGYVHQQSYPKDNLAMKGIHFVVCGEVFGNSQCRLDSERKEAGLELVGDEGFEAYGLVLGGGLYYLCSNHSGSCQTCTNSERHHDCGVNPGVMIIVHV